LEEKKLIWGITQKWVMTNTNKEKRVGEGGENFEEITKSERNEKTEKKRRRRKGNDRQRGEK